MSQDLIDGLRRRLVPADAADADEPVAEERAAKDRPAGHPPTAGDPAGDVALADGGRRSDDDEGDDADAHLRDLPDGAGCAEIWEHLSERQAERRSDDRPTSECQADD